jgi:hypothetical protein
MSESGSPVPADLHKSFEGLHKLTPFQLQLSAVNRATGARRALWSRGSELTAECQTCSRNRNRYCENAIRLEVPAGIKRILILIVYTDRARTRLHPRLVAHWDTIGAGDFGPYLDLTLLTAGGRRGRSPHGQSTI